MTWRERNRDAVNARDRELYGEAVVMLDAHEGTLRADETRTRPTVVRWRLPPGAWDIVGYHPTARYEASITIAPRDDGRGASAQLWTRAAKGGAT